MGNQNNSTQKRKQQKLSRELGKNSLHDAYEKMFSMVEFVLARQGHISHQIMGLEFKKGKIRKVHALPVEDDSVEKTPEYIERMLSKYPMVVHVFEAWSSPDDSVKPSEHSQRQDVVELFFYTEAQVHVSTCVRDMEKGTISKGEIFKPDQVGGRLAKPMPVTH